MKAKKSNLVIEVNSGNEVIGLTVLKLEGCANKIILPGTATDERPIKVFEGWMDVVCPFSKKVRGSVFGRVGVGLERQVERGERGDGCWELYLVDFSNTLMIFVWDRVRGGYDYSDTAEGGC